MNGRAAFSLAVLPLLLGCRVASVAVEASAVAENTCDSNADCAGGLCSANRCYGTTSELHTFLFQVTPASNTAAAGVQLETLKDLGGTIHLTVAGALTVTGSITAGNIGCQPSFLDAQGQPLSDSLDHSIPAQVTLTPSEQLLGLASASTVVQTSADAQGNHSFSVSLSPGYYDLYVEPARQPADGSCLLPPELAHRVMLSSSLTIDSPMPSTFQLEVDWPPQADPTVTLQSWFADMLDPVTGQVISNRAPLVYKQSQTPDLTSHYLANIVYAPLASGLTAAPGQELIRLRLLTNPGCSDAPSAKDSCADVAAPTLLMARNALSLFSASSGTLTQFTQIPTAVHVEGQVTRLGAAAYAQAHVTLIAQQLDGIDPGLFATYTRSADTNTDGTFAADLLPGTYAVYAVPATGYGVGVQCVIGDSSNPCLAQGSDTWQVAASPATQGGRLIQLTPAIPVFGAAADFAGHPLVGAQVQAPASPAALSNDVLVAARGQTSSLFIPRSSSDVIADTGGFKLWADPGTFDLSVRPQAGTGFAWLVRPGVKVPSDAYQNGFALGAMQLPLPIGYSGSVDVQYPGASGAGALIRTYVYTQTSPSGVTYTEHPELANGVLQVAETRADSQGHFELLIPAKLNQPAP